jgi:hypothetical protein
VSDPAAVEAAVRSFLEEMLRAVEAPGELDLRRLDVVQVSADRATAEVAAAATWTVDHPVYGRIVRAEDLSGPVDLERDGGGWRVVDVTVDGRRRSDSVTEAPGWVEEDGLRVGRLALDLGGRHTTVTFAVENRGALPVVVFEALRGARTLGMWTYLPVPLMKTVEVEPGARRGARAGWQEVFPLDTEELRLVVRAGEIDGSRRLELHFAVRRAPRPELVPLGPPPWPARLSVRRRRRLQLVPLAAVALPLALRWFRAAGIVLALLGLVVAAQVGYLSLIRRRGRPNDRAVVAALATVAVGVWLAWLDPS